MDEDSDEGRMEELDPDAGRIKKDDAFPKSVCLVTPETMQFWRGLKDNLSPLEKDFLALITGCEGWPSNTRRPSK